MAAIGLIALLCGCDSIWGETKSFDRRQPPPPRTGGLSALKLPEPRPGLRLVLTPNLPGVSAEDVPTQSGRQVEILHVKGASVTLQWSGRTRIETQKSLAKRERWMKERFESPRRAQSLPEPKPEYEEREVGGVLTFPDFNIARSFLLPGLWPEGERTLEGTSTLWISRGVSASLMQSRSADLVFLDGKPLGDEPVQVLFRRLTGIRRLSTTTNDAWELSGDSVPVICELDGQDTAVDAFPVQNWLGQAEVAEAETSLLVLSVMPELPETVYRIPAPPNLIRTVFGYRISSIGEREGSSQP